MLKARRTNEINRHNGRTGDEGSRNYVSPHADASVEVDCQPFFEKEEHHNMNEVESLRASIALSRSKALDLLVEIDDIKLRQIPIIKAEYEVKIGCWQVELLRAQIAMRRAKRKLEMVRASINRGVEIDMAACDKQLDEELQEWHEELLCVMRRYKESIEFHSTLKPTRVEKLEAFKALYRKLAKRLHPDLHPSNPDAVELFLIAKQAYEDGDFVLLESLEVATRSFEQNDESLDAMSIDELQIELEICDAHIAALVEQIAEIKRSRPYCYKSLLDDPVAIDKEARSYKEKIGACQAAQREFESCLKELLS